MSNYKDETESNDELLKKIEELEAANRSKNAFIANISHEVRTPMNAILGFSELILQLDASEQASEYAMEIKSASKNLMAIINDLLDISKIESGRMELVPMPYFLHYLFSDIEAVMSIPVAKKGIAFKLNINPELPGRLYGDIVRIRQILTNLCNNAVKFTNEGFVELSATFTEGCSEEVFEKCFGDNESMEDIITLEFKVSDTGIGIRNEDLELIFDNFRQVDMRLNRNVEGSGLGLSICRQLVGLMNGELTVSSEYGKGTEFTVRIPQKVVDRNKVSTYIATHKQEEKRKKSYLYAPGARILVVDDNPVNLRILKDLLIHYEIDSDTAASGREAVEMVSGKNYDLILLDQMMPDMNGEETLTAIKKIPDREKIPIIAVTANAIRGIRDDFIRKGFTDYLSKPIETVRLEEILKECLPANLFVHGEEEEDIPETKPDIEIPGIDIDAGLAKSDNNVKDYLDILEIVVEYGPEKIREIRSFAKVKDYSNYVIAVHSLKSVAANIGAHQLHTMAKIHEMAGKQGNYGFVDDNYEKLVSLYEAIVTNIGAGLKELRNKEE